MESSSSAKRDAINRSPALMVASVDNGDLPQVNNTQRPSRLLRTVSERAASDTASILAQRLANLARDVERLALDLEGREFNDREFNDREFNDREFNAQVGVAVLQAHYRLVAREILEVLDLIVRDEVGAAQLGAGLNRLLSRLGAGFAEERLVLGLHRLVAQWQQTDNGSQSDLSIDALRQVVSDLQLVIDWYQSRRATMSRIADEQEYTDEEGVFGVHVCHDRLRSGVMGMEVCAAVRLNHRAGQQLWLKAVLSRAGRAVPARKGWQYWVDNTDTLFLEAANLDETQLANDDTNVNGSGVQAEGLFASLVPLAINRNVAIIDNAAVFVPYEALDLTTVINAQRANQVSQHGSQGQFGANPNVACELDLELMLLDESGRILASRVLPVEISPTTHSSPVSGLRGGVAVAKHPVPSPQAHGMWAEDSVSGDRISNVRVRQGIRGGWTASMECLSVSLDLLLRGRAEVQSSAEATLECRFLTLDGDLVKRRAISNTVVGDATQEILGGISSVASRDFVCSLTLRPDHPVCPFYDLTLEIPIGALDLPQGSHPLYVEVAAVLPGGQIICGVLEPYTLLMPAHAEELSRIIIAPDSAAAGVGAGGQLSGIQIDTRTKIHQANQVQLSCTVHTLERINGVPIVRVRPQIAISTLASRTVRVVSAIETVDGQALISAYSFAPGFAQQRALQHSLSLILDSASLGQERSFEVSFAFDRREVLAGLEGLLRNGENPGALVARTRVFSDNDRLVAEHTTQFAWRADEVQLSSHQLDIPHETAAIVELRTVGWSSPTAMRCRSWVNLDSASPESNLAHAEYQILGRDGSPIAGQSQADQKVSLAAPGQSLRASQNRDWYQRAFEFDIELGSLLREAAQHRSLYEAQGVVVKVMVFSGAGRLLQIVYHDLFSADERLLSEARKMLGIDRAPELLPKPPGRSIWEALVSWFR